MSNQLDRILKIIQRTSDKVIVLKDDSEFVIASLDSYNQLIEGESPLGQLTESQMLDKINRDIALWRESQKELNSQEKELDFLDQPLDPRYDSSDLTTQDKLDQLNQNIFDPDEKTDKLEKDWDWDTDLEQSSPDIQKDQDSSEDYQAHNFDEPASFDLDQDLDFDPDPLESTDLEDISDDIEDIDIQDIQPDNQDILEETQPETQEIKPGINNFGHPNPSDTNINNSENEDSWLELDKNQPESDDFKHIPPPPDIPK